MGGTVFLNGLDCQVVLQGQTLLPEDRYVTTYSFTQGAAPTNADRDNVAARLVDFVTASGDGAASPLMDFLSPVVEDDFEVRVYTHGDPEPREPTIYDATLTPGGGTPLPSEVAVCLSYYGTRNIPTQRGRIYWGPLNGGAGTLSVIGGEARPSVNLRASLAASGAALASPGQPGGNWVVWSRKLGTAFTITDGWVDDAFDTQRRRGVDPASRTTWTAA